MKVFLGAGENCMHLIFLTVSKRNVAQHPLRRSCHWLSLSLQNKWLWVRFHRYKKDRLNVRVK